MPPCTTGFSLPEVLALLGTVMGMVGLPVGIQFRAMQAQNRELLDLLKDQIGILREQAEIQSSTEKVIRTNHSRRRP